MRVDENDGLALSFAAHLIAADGTLEPTESMVELAFPLVAQLRYTMLHFWEHHDFELEPVTHRSRGFYTVVDSTWQRDLGLRNTDGFAHYLVTGYDAYVEVLAGTYRISTISPASVRAR